MCVSVFSLVRVVKRGLISSNVIHTVTSHYFPSAGSLSPFALSRLFSTPPPPFIFSRLSLFLSPPFLKYFLHHIKERTTFLLSPPLTTFLGPFSSSWFFYSTILFSHPHHLSLHQPFLSLSIIVPFPMVDVLTSFVFFTAHSQQQKKLISQHFISFEFNCFCRWICVQSLSKYALSFHAGLNFCEL